MITEHTKHKYEECYAKLILEHFLPEKFASLILRDKPDLGDEIHNIGIEVTEAASPGYKEAETLWYSMYEKSKEKQIKAIVRMKKLGYEYSKVMGWPMNEYENGDLGVYNIVFEAVQKKLKKLNDHSYSKYGSMHLFILTYLWISEEITEVFLQALSEMEKTYRDRYDVIYIAAQNTFFEFNLRYMTWQSFDMNDVQYSLAVAAKKICDP